MEERPPQANQPFATPTDGLAPALITGLFAHLAVAIVGVVAVPFYFGIMGPDGYGLVGVYVVLQSWVLLLDLGLSPAVARQLSRFRAGALGAKDAARLLGAAETVFVCGGAAVVAAFLVFSRWIAGHWLGPSALSPRTLDVALELTGALLVLRWLTGLYQTALVGLERQVAVNTVLVIAAVTRSAGTVALLLWISPSPVTFFAAQALFTLAEVTTMRLLLARAMPRPVGAHGGWPLLAKEAPFAAGLLLSAAVATLINQADKVALSHVMPLAAFGAFSLVVTICTGIALVAPPFVQAFQPRLTALLAQGRRVEFVRLYRIALALLLGVVAALAGTIAAQPEAVLFAWTGDRNLGVRLAPILTLYALGTGIASFLFAPFVLQYAQGNVRLHVRGNLIFGAVWIPAAVWVAYRFGPLGTGVTWLAGNLLYLLLWAPLVHRRMLSRPERQGLDLGAAARVAALGLALLATRAIDASALGRVASLALLVAISTGVGLAAIALSGELRAQGAALLAARRRR